MGGGGKAFRVNTRTVYSWSIAGDMGRRSRLTVSDEKRECHLDFQWDLLRRFVETSSIQNVGMRRKSEIAV